MTKIDLDTLVHLPQADELTSGQKAQVLRADWWYICFDGEPQYIAISILDFSMKAIRTNPICWREHEQYHTVTVHPCQDEHKIHRGSCEYFGT